MINKIQEDLSKELNCNPKEIKLLDEIQENGLKVRRVVYQNNGFKITTDAADTAYVNIEPFVPNQKPPQVKIDLTPPKPKVNYVNKIKRLSPGVLFAIGCGVLALIYILV